MFFCFSARAFDFDDISKIIHQQNVRSVEKLLPLLPEDFRSHYTLMHESRSLQAATLTEPRVILFGSDARLTCTFNGSLTQFGGDTIECFQFRDSEKRFDFRQIRFPTDDNHLTETQFSDSNKSADGRISCSACHGADPRPNWDGYSTWPGAYGSDDDEMHINESTPYKVFVSARATHPRYRWLIQNNNNPLSPYSSSAALIEERPNLRLSDLFGRMNSRRAGRLMKARFPAWASLAFAMRALKCELSADQAAKAQSENADFATALTLKALYARLQIPAGEWTTQVFNDQNSNSDEDFEHQAGFGYLSLGVAMDVLEDYAGEPNSPLPAIFANMKVAATQSTNPPTDAAILSRFFETLNSISLTPNTFNPPEMDSATAALCPVVTDLFTKSYVAGSSTLGARVSDARP